MRRDVAPRRCGHPEGESSGGELAGVEVSGGGGSGWRGSKRKGARGVGWGQGGLGGARETQWHAKRRPERSVGRESSGGDGSRAPVELEEEEGDRDLFVNLGKFRGLCVN